ncbi:MAG: TIGR01212 family radical SAM protein [Gammaproteobacteria bacterium]|nr:TIGR01212 family radical SAM protein [Gammaproteobacteria bacterium]
MYLPAVVNSFGSAMRSKYGEKVHKVSINAAFTCPNRDGSKGIGGCSFCNNNSFSPVSTKQAAISEQIDAGQAVIRRRTGAEKFIAYFQAYTNTYAEVDYLRQQYDLALQSENVIGLSVGTRPDCVPDAVLQLLAEYQQQGHEVWLELGLQSAMDESLQRVNRGHGFAEYVDAVKRARGYGLQICTHLIVGLPGESPQMTLESHRRVMELGTHGLKLHPLHVVRHTLLAKQWKQGSYTTLDEPAYINTACELIKQTPPEVMFHRLTATANESILLAPAWCNKKWAVLNAIYQQLLGEGEKQGSKLH